MPKRGMIKALHIAHDHDKRDENTLAMKIRWKYNYGSRFN
jgi:hypothetical protein